MRIDKQEAARVLRAAADAHDRAIDAVWEAKVEEFSRLCDEGVSKTHIAFLGTAMLAKSVSPDVDLYAIKPEHAEGNPRAYSARSLCHGVLVPLAAELGFNIGVTGREPLNNQPYFRMTRLDDGTPVHQGGRRAFDYMLGLVSELQALESSMEARAALRAFVEVRQRYLTRYRRGDGEASVTPEELSEAIMILVRENSEGGRRAQAVAAGLFDVFAGSDRVESGRINDPSRKYPGDVCVRGADGEGWAKAVEVRDKPVSDSDIQIFGAKCVAMGVREAAVLMAADRQPELDNEALQSWANERGIGLTLFYGWKSFVEQTLFWSEQSKPVAALEAVSAVRNRLIAVEATPDAVALWQQLCSAGTN